MLRIGYGWGACGGCCRKDRVCGEGLERRRNGESGVGFSLLTLSRSKQRPPTPPHLPGFASLRRVGGGEKEGVARVAYGFKSRGRHASTVRAESAPCARRWQAQISRGTSSRQVRHR